MAENYRCECINGFYGRNCETGTIYHPLFTLTSQFVFLLVDAYSIKGKENLSLRSVREPRGRASPYAQPPGTITIIRY